MTKQSYDQMGQFNYGEALVCEIFKALNTLKKPIPGYHYPSREKLKNIADFCNASFEVNQVMDSILLGKNVHNFNRLHRIDLAAVMENEVHPLEVKLGISNKTKNFPGTFFKHCKDPLKYLVSNKEFSGNMIKILDERKFENQEMFLHSNGKKLSDNWSIVIRKASMTTWPLKYRSQDGFSKLKYVFVYEELLTALDMDQRQVMLQVNKLFAEHKELFLKF